MAKETLQQLLDRLPDNVKGDISEADMRANTTELYKAFDASENDFDPTGSNLVATNTDAALKELDSNKLPSTSESTIGTGATLRFDNIFGTIYNASSPSGAAAVSLDVGGAKIGGFAVFYNNGTVEPNITPIPTVLSGEYVSGEVNAYKFVYSGSGFTQEIINTAVSKKADKDGETLTNATVNGVSLDATGSGGSNYLDDKGNYTAPPSGSGGEINTTSTSGTGAALTLTKVGSDLPFRGVKGVGATITTDADSLTIAAASAAQGAKADSATQPSDLSAVATSGDYTDLSNKPTIPPVAPVDSVAGKTGAVTLVKADVGLDSVDNTSDANKPISTATQTALDAKQSLGANNLVISTTTHTLVAANNGKTIFFTNVAGCAATVPSGLPNDFHCNLVKADGAGDISLVVTAITPIGDVTDMTTTGGYIYLNHLAANKIYFTR